MCTLLQTWNFLTRSWGTNLKDNFMMLIAENDVDAQCGLKMLIWICHIKERAQNSKLAGPQKYAAQDWSKSGLKEYYFVNLIQVIGRMQYKEKTSRYRSLNKPLKILDGVLAFLPLCPSMNFRCKSWLIPSAPCFSLEELSALSLIWSAHRTCLWIFKSAWLVQCFPGLFGFFSIYQ